VYQANDRCSECSYRRDGKDLRVQVAGTCSLLVPVPGTSTWHGTQHARVLNAGIQRSSNTRHKNGNAGDCQ
jgi:hypothetical protein